MPEGDTIRYAAHRLGDALVEAEIRAIEAPHTRHARERWPQRLAGRSVRAVDTHGKHLFIRFEGGLTLHSHLRMTGKWGVYANGGRWTRSPRRAWLVLRTDASEVVQFDGPVLELMTDSRTRFDRRLALLGPDVLADDFDERAFLRRLRADDPTRGIGDALLDQQTVAGIGNIWKAEACFAAGVDPWRRTAQVGDEEALAVVRAARGAMQSSVEQGLRVTPAVYDRAGRPCPRCERALQARGQGADNRTTYWCPRCQT